jgi:hypothetical protein
LGVRNGAGEREQRDGYGQCDLFHLSPPSPLISGEGFLRSGTEIVFVVNERVQFAVEQDKHALRPKVSGQVARHGQYEPVALVLFIDDAPPSARCPTEPFTPCQLRGLLSLRRA